jgi:hypothetical protein
MSLSPAQINRRAAIEPTDWSWTTAVLVVLAAVALTVGGIALGSSLDDGRQVRRLGETTPRTTVAPAAVSSLDMTDLGGSIHHRGGNQP